MASPQDVISQLRQKYEKAYGFALLELSVQEKQQEVHLRGRVLTAKQKEEVLAEIAKVSGKEVTGRIGVLSDPASSGLGWAVVKVPLADLRSRFVSTGILSERIRRRLAASQVSRGEVVRIIAQKEDQLLVQSADLTLGWLERREVVVKKISLRKNWRAGVSALPDRMIPVRSPLSTLILAAESYLGVKYVLGTKSEQSLDCSGFTQRAYADAWRIILPKHSWDQKKMGVRVDLAQAGTGDLVFMQNKITGTKHVGIWEVIEDKKNILHASLAQGKVVRQSAEEVFLHYDLVELRRIVKK